MQTRRRLPVIAGMSLSAVIIAAPAAHADNFLSPKQDCSEILVQKAEDKGDGGLVSIFEGEVDALENFLIGVRKNASNIRVTKVKDGPVEITDSFNCANIFDRSFRDDSKDKRHDHRRHDHRRHDHRRHDQSHKR